MTSSKLYLDSETAGLHSMPVLLQYAEGDGPIVLYDVWKRPIGGTIDLIEHFCRHTIVGFNLAFDWFQIAKLYTIFRLCPREWIPEEHVNAIAAREMDGRDGPAVKPAGALDLMLHSRKGRYQALMARNDIHIRKVPTVLAYALAEELERRVQLDGIYFARHADANAPRWHVFDRKDKHGEIDKDFKDVVLRFAPAGGLKYLAEYAMGYKPKFHYHDVEPPRHWFPIEYGYAPFAAAVSTAEKGWEVWGKDDKGRPKLFGYAWPGVIRQFASHWATHRDAREYASDDILYTRALDAHFDYPEPNDDDSVLACMVPVVRWRGYRVDLEGIRELRSKALETLNNSPCNVNKPGDVRRYLTEALDDIEDDVIEDTTEKKRLEKLAKLRIEEEEECTKCFGGDSTGCQRCQGTGKLMPGAHPVAPRAKLILGAKLAKKEIELYDKMLLAGRFHADFVVLGTKSSRMSGAGGLNAQGIKRDKSVRRKFTLAWPGYVLCGGDFDSFEVTLADAVYDDPALRNALCSGRKIHALFGMSLFPGHGYEEIVASDGTSNDMYTAAKQGVFGMIYGGDWGTLVRNLGIGEDVAKEAYEDWGRRYPGIERARQKTFNAFCSMKQVEGRQVIWDEPAEYVESFLGFRRYFTLETQICRALFELAQSPPKHWRDTKVKVWRRDRVQVASGAVSSALYGAAFAIQNAAMRAAANHEIQSPGGQITKRLQRCIWDLQPAGIGDLVVAPANIHDELMCVTHPDHISRVTAVVRQTVESYRPQVPLIGITWFEAMSNWAEKKAGQEAVRVRSPLMK